MQYLWFPMPPDTHHQVLMFSLIPRQAISVKSNISAVIFYTIFQFLLYDKLLVLKISTHMNLSFFSPFTTYHITNYDKYYVKYCDTSEHCSSVKTCIHKQKPSKNLRANEGWKRGHMSNFLWGRGSVCRFGRQLY